jgi:hypothetical protein
MDAKRALLILETQEKAEGNNVYLLLVPVVLPTYISAFGLIKEFL